MGYRDHLLRLCIDQTVTEEVSDFYIDTGIEYPGWDTGWPLEVIITVKTAATGGTGYVFWLLHNATTAPTLTAADYLATAYVLNANLVKGAEIKLRFPEGIKIQRYVGIHIADITSGESMVIDAYISPVTA